MSSSEVKLEDLRIPLEEIKSGTAIFNAENHIGGGGFGKVYKGKLSNSRGDRMVAIKQLNPAGWQGKHEFKNEVSMLYSYKHKNIVTLIGYCDEGAQMIILYEYAVNGSLDKHLCDTNKMQRLSWEQRLKICIGAAEGLAYLHSGIGADLRVIHRDVKSSNILLDGDWEAKVSDFGLSKFAPKNQPYTHLNTRIAGTGGYCDPHYQETGELTKESDVYSFGVVLFEMLCGRLVFPIKKNCNPDHDDSQNLVALVRRYKDNLGRIIDPHIRDQIEPKSLDTFKEIAYQCLKMNYKKRPQMAIVVGKLKIALISQMANVDGKLKIALIPQENFEVLKRCIKENLGFKDDKPIAVSVMYKCLLHWHAFESERTTAFDFIIVNINSVLQDGNEDATLPYWLSNASALLCVLQRNFPSNRFLTPISQRSAASSVANGKGYKSPFTYIGYEAGCSHKEATHPAKLFKQQLTACVEKIFGLIRDNVKKEISPLLELCIQATKIQPVNGAKSSRSPGGIPHQVPGSQWEKIIEFLDSFMDRLRGNHVPSFFIRKLTTQVFSFINTTLFNSLLLRRKCCTFSNGEYVKSGLAELEKWIANAKEEFAGTSWHELNFIRQAVGFLVVHQKEKKSLKEISQDLCPVLRIEQIYHISTRYWGDKYGNQGVSSEVVAEMNEMLNNDPWDFPPNSILLDDDALSIPFSTEDIYMAIPAIDLTDVEPPAFFAEYP